MIRTRFLVFAGSGSFQARNAESLAGYQENNPTPSYQGVGTVHCAAYNWLFHLRNLTQATAPTNSNLTFHKYLWDHW